MLKPRILLLPLLLFLQTVFCYKSIIDFLSEDKRFDTLLTHLQHFQLVQLVNDLEAGTLFAPDNEAFKQSKIKVDRSSLLYHLVKKGVQVDDLYDGQLKETLYVRPGYLGPDSKAGQRIKVTKDNKKVFINQAKIIDRDLQVNNQTYVQVIDRVLQPPESLGDIVLQRNKAIHELMNSTEIVDLLQQNKPFTLILSTKTNPLEKFNDVEQSYLTSSYGRDDLSLFFEYAIINKTVFIDEFNSGKTTYKSLSGDSLVIAADKEKKTVTVNDIPIKHSDIIAANGVIHEIDETFKPEVIEFNTRKYLYGANGTHMVELIDKYGLGHFVDKKEINHTFLIPSHDTINQSLVSRAWLGYHIIQDAWDQDHLASNMLLKSEFKSYDLGERHQRIPVHVENADVLFSTTASKSLQFDRSRVIGDGINVKDDLIYQISEPLTLPGDILGKLVVDLDVSTFIATLYVSGVVEEIKDTKGLTLFVPTNDAFQNLGLVAKYLVHPSAKSQLQSVLRYHAVRDVLYDQDMKSQVHEVPTLANSTLRISQDESGSVMIGRPEGGNAASLTCADILVSNGVVHKVSEVQIPNQVRVTNENILTGIEASAMIQVLKKANLLDTINQDNMVVLVPSDKAFAHIDLDALLADQYQLERLAKLHILPTGWQDRWIQDSNRHDKSEYPTLLSDDDKVAVRENEKGELFVEVKNGGDGDRAHVNGLGRVSAGGGVIYIDSVLVPIRRGLFGLPFVWSVMVTLTLIVIVSGLLSIVGFFSYKIYNRRRLGYRPIFDQ